MSNKNDTVVTAISLVISLAIVGGLGWWFVSNGNFIGQSQSPFDRQANCQTNSAAILSLAVRSDYQILASASSEGQIEVWDWEKQQKKYEPLQAHEGRINDIALTRNGETLVSGGGDGTVKLWDFQTGKMRQNILNRRFGRILSVATSADGLKIAASSDTGKVLVWNLAEIDANPQPVQLQIETQQNKIQTVAFNPANPNILASGGNDGKIRIWNLETKRETALSPIEKQKVTHIFDLTFSSDGQKLASATNLGEIDIWNLNNGERNTLKFNAHDFLVRAVNFGNSQQYLATASYDETVKRWNFNPSQAEQKVNTLYGHFGFVYDVAFLKPNGQILASAGYDGTLRIWKQDNQQGEWKNFILCQPQK